MCAAHASALPVQKYSVDTTQSVHAIDARIYGQFLEHIFNSVHGGLWGDMILNGGFVMPAGAGAWSLKDYMVYLTSPATNQKVLLGDPQWTDYELTLDARKDLDRGEGFMVMFRVAPDQHYWMNFGGWNNAEHGLERNGAPVKRVPGKLDTGKWYKVKVRCEGAHMQAWLDDQPVIDLIDNKPIPKGRIGLNTWGSKASFKNIKVTALDGKVLLDRLPTQEEIAVAPAYWTTTGTGGFCSFDADDSISGNGATVIHGTATDPTVGLQQLPLNIVKTETYTGRIYLKSPDAATATVTISGDPATATALTPFVKRIPNIAPTWKAYDFQFTANASDPAVTARVCVSGKGTVKISNFTLFSKTALANGGFRPDILKAIMDIKPTTIRYPGGCFASGYKWQDAIGPHEKRRYYPGVIWNDQDPNQMGTDEFMQLCEKVGAEPILAINKSRGVQDALDWLEYCNGATTTKWGKLRADNGRPAPYNVKYWEIDNEVWGMPVENYAKEVTLFSQAIKAKDPNAIIIACGGYGYDDGKGSSNGWNKKLLDNCAKDFDFLSIHYYNGICYEQDFVKDPRRYEAYMKEEIGKMIRESANPKIKIYCSEWGQMNAEWRGGLYTAGVLNAFERISDLCPMSCPAVWMQRISVNKPNPSWASCQILYDHQTFVPAPEYVVQKLWRDNLGTNLVTMDGPTDPLNAVASLSRDNKTLFFKAVNPSAELCEVELTLTKSSPKSATMTIVAPGTQNAKNTLTDTTKVAAQPATAKVAGKTITLEMPALSVGVVKITLN